MQILPHTMLASSDKSREAVQLSLLAIILALPGLWLLLHYQLSVLFFLVVFGIFSIAWHFSKTATLLALFSYLFLLGDIRRISGLLTGTVRLDPLLVVGPLFTIFVCIPIFLKLRVTNAFSKAVLALTVILALSIVNPRQGSLFVGLSGAMFFLIPMFWFWIARAYATERIMFLVLFRVVVPLGVLAAMLGFYQTYVGFLPWEEAWIQRVVASGYTALNLGNGHIRSFGFSVNSAEYVTLLMISTVCVVAAVTRGRRAYAVFLPPLIAALILASSRGAIVKVVVGVVAIWALRGRNIWTWLPRIALGIVVAIALLIYAGRHTEESTSEAAKGDTANLATSHVSGGLAHPLDPRHSTLGNHAHMFLTGIATGFADPLGNGLGIVTLGAGKFGAESGTFGSSEVDISDVFITTGFIGGFFYIFTIGVGLFSCGRLVLSKPDMISFALVGILCCMLQAWIPLGSYAAGPLVWFCLGYLAQDRLPAASHKPMNRSNATVPPAILLAGNV